MVCITKNVITFQLFVHVIQQVCISLDPRSICVWHVVLYDFAFYYLSIPQQLMFEFDHFEFIINCKQML